MTATACSTTLDCLLDDGQKWQDLQTWLLPLVEMWVYYADVPSWYGQQREIAEDITQEAMLRTFRYSQRADRGEVRIIASLKSLSRTIAQNHFRDRRKKERCLVRPTYYDTIPDGYALRNEQVDPSEIAIDELMSTSVIVNAARLVVKFPPRQRSALLTDLANTADFNAPPTLLTQALSEEGINLRDYHHPVPAEPAERNRYAALLCIAYKRLRKEVEV